MSNSLLRQLWQQGKIKSEAAALAVIAIVFVLFFWPAILKGQLLVFSDSLIYSYPLRVVAFDALWHGSLPLWTPTLLSGYPLLSMAQLGLGYPLTWFYLFLPGYWAEQIYVLAPYLLAPAFTYAYLRQIGCSRLAGLLAGLSFTYGGLMAGGIAHNGMFSNAVMWLPLMLIAIERSRTGQFELCLLGVAGAYSMSVLTGIGQAFLYTGLIAVAYAVFVTFVIPPNIRRRHWYSTGSSNDRVPLMSLTTHDPVATAPGTALKAGLRTVSPVIVCVGGMGLAAGVAAFQILETMRVQRRSIRSELPYDVFSGGGFTAWQTLKAFFAPYHNLNWEATPTINLLAGLLAIVAMLVALLAPANHRRTFFWLGLALLGWLLMMGDHTPLYRLAFHVPVLNRFRLPWRHTFEWSFAVSMLAAFGLDALRKLLRNGERQRPEIWPKRPMACFRSLALPVPPLSNGVPGMVLFIGVIGVSVGWWIASGLRMAAGEALLKNGDSTQYVALSQPAWLAWKFGVALLALLTVAWCWRWQAAKLRSVLLASTIALACCLEAFMLVSVWWFPYARPASYYQTVSASTQFLKQYAPEQNRIYTSASDYSFLNHALTGVHNLSAIAGFHNAAGYEPLMLEKYNRAFEGRWSFFTPWFGAPTDSQILSPRWQVLDLLNTRFLADFSTAKTKTIEKDGVLFTATDIAIPLPSKATAILTGSALPVDSLSIVSTLANSTHLTQGETVARIAIHTTDGRIIEHELKAGRDTAEWAHERPDVRSNIKHGLAPVFDSQSGDVQNSFPANRYWTHIDLGEKLVVDRIEMTNVAPIASLAISKAALYDSSTRSAVLLTQRLPDHWRKVYEQDAVQIYENQRVLPRAWLTPKAEAVSSEEALRRIRGESEQPFDPKATALLEAPPEKLRALNAGDLGFIAEARIVGYEPNRLAIETNAEKQSVLIASEINYPGWEATIDGQRTEIYAADYLLRGILMPAGRHRVEMRYRAPAARNGALFSVLSLLTITGLLVKGGWHWGFKKQ